MVFALVLAGGALVADAAYMHTVTLKQGSSGSQVVELQKALGGLTADGSFGPMTKAAVKAFQTSKGLTADGVVGPMTGAALAGMGGGSGGTLPAGCTSTAGYSSTTGEKCDSTGGGGGGPITGGAGSITWDDKSTYSNEDVIAGDENAKVLAFEIEADDESDVDITSIKVELAQTVGTNSEDITDYMESVSVWMGSKKVGESDADTFSENSDIYTRNISLDGAVVKAGETEDFVVAVTALNNLDSGDIDDDAFTVDVISVRFEDGEGVVTTENTDSAPDLAQAFDFDDLATSGDLELKLTEGTGNPDPTVVEVDDTSDTDVTMLEFKLKAEGSDMVIDNMEFDTLALGVDATFTDMVSDISLMVGSNELDSTATAVIAQAAGGDTILGTSDDVAGTIEFTDLDYTIDQDDTVTFKVVAKIKDILTSSGSATAFDQGDSFAVSFTGANLDDTTNTDVEDENGDTVGAGDRTGSVTGENQTFYSNGINITLDSTDADAFTVDGVNNDRVELVIKFKVTAFGQDAYVRKINTVTSASATSSGTAPTNAQGVGVHLQSADAQLTTAKGLPILSSTADEETNSYKVNEGSTETFTLKVNVDNAIATAGDLDGAQVRAILTGVGFAASDSATNGDYTVYTSNLQDDFKTAYATIAD